MGIHVVRSLGVLAVAAIALAPLTAASQSPSPDQPASPAAAGPRAVVTTRAGVFVMQLRPDLAPRHVRHFVKTARAKGFDGTTFHRIVPRGIIQGGDPLSKDPAKKKLYGTGGLGLLRAEFSSAPMARGSVAAVLRPSSIHSAGNQFFVCLSDQPSLTGKFTIFGEVVEGMDVVDRLGEAEVAGDVPRERIVIETVVVRE